MKFFRIFFMTVPKQKSWFEAMIGIICWDLIDIFQNHAFVFGVTFQERGYKFVLKSPGTDNIEYPVGWSVKIFLFFRNPDVHNQSYNRLQGRATGRS